MPTTLFQSAKSALASSIDEAAGVIRKVAVITEGPALGHGLMIDRTTLDQIKKAAETYTGGLKVKMNHGGGVEDIVGFLTNFAIEGGKLVADFHLLKTAARRDYILEIARTIPDTFGMSVAFSGKSDERSGVNYARCTEIYSCDLVSEPAANPDGLFSRRFDEWQKHKGHTPATSSDSMENELLSEIAKLIDTKLATISASFDKQISELKTAQTTTLGRIEDVSKLATEAADKAALAAVKEFSKTLGQPAGSAAAPSAPPAAPVVKKFEELVREHPKYAISKNAAISDVVAKNPQSHREYLGRVQTGEVILF